jgi:hypothetical protein
MVQWLNVGRHVRTKKHPVQPIPLFEELIALLMEVGLALEHRGASAKIMADSRRRATVTSS